MRASVPTRLSAGAEEALQLLDQAVVGELGRRLQQLVEDEPVEQRQQLRGVRVRVAATGGRQQLLDQQQVLAPDLVERELELGPPPGLEE